MEYPFYTPALLALRVTAARLLLRCCTRRQVGVATWLFWLHKSGTSLHYIRGRTNLQLLELVVCVEHQGLHGWPWAAATEPILSSFAPARVAVRTNPLQSTCGGYVQVACAKASFKRLESGCVVAIALLLAASPSHL